MAFSVGLATTVALFMGSVAYGINVITFFTCINALFRSNGHPKPLSTINFVMAIAALLMFTVATVDIGAILDHNIKMFIDKDHTALLSDRLTRWTMIHISTLFIQTFLGDAILIYRCFVVWNRKWRIIVGPAILSLTGTACGIATLILISTLRSPVKADTAPFYTSLLALTLSSNFSSSALIVYRIWTVSKKASPYRTNFGQRDPLARAVRITIEAGLLYTASTVVLLTTFAIGHNAHILLTRVVIQIIGINFNLIINPTCQRETLSTCSSTAPEIPLERLVIKTETYISRDPPENQTRSMPCQKSGLPPSMLAYAGPSSPLSLQVQKVMSSRQKSSTDSVV